MHRYASSRFDSSLAEAQGAINDYGRNDRRTSENRRIPRRPFLRSDRLSFGTRVFPHVYCVRILIAAGFLDGAGLIDLAELVSLRSDN